MSHWTIIPVSFALASVVVVLAIGLIQFARKGADNARQSNKLMRLRVFFQLLAILMMFALFIAR